MKKVLLICLVIIQIAALYGCGHSGQSSSGNEYGVNPPCNHSYQDATCTEPKTCTHCGKEEGGALGHDYAPATFSKPATCTRCFETTGSALPPVSEWGYNTLDIMGNSLVDITGYNVKRFGSDSYVTVTGNTYLFENGYVLRKDFPLKTGNVAFENTRVLYSYKVVDNNNLDLGNGYDTESITERKTTKYRDDFVVFVVQDLGWFIPYSLIDWDRGISLSPDTESESEPEYILYLKDFY
ncbi:MAG: hypothetical protein E7466_03235 [Ruminococcaceae bacterium]|nr:hypothetical protein [Oscillospiraceae bacterium]